MHERKLYLVPTVHTAANIDPSMLRVIRAQYPDFDNLVERYHEGVEQFVTTLQPGDLQGCNLYLDGYDSRTVQALNRGGATAFRVMLDTHPLSKAVLAEEYRICELMERGGRIFPAENDNLLEQTRKLMEYMSKATSLGLSEDVHRLGNRLRGVNKQRDESIVAAINRSLRSTGILFIGAAHDVKGRLEKRGILVEVPQIVFEYLTPEDLANDEYLRAFKKTSE